MKRPPVIIMAILCAALSPMPLLAQSGGSGNLDSNLEAAIAELSFPDEGDYSELSWGAAFFAMHDFFSRAYAFGDWKQIPWNSMASYFGQKIMAAEAEKDLDSYSVAMVEYVRRIPDGHVKLTGPFEDLTEQFIGGSYGLGLAELDDGSIVVAAIKPESPAAKAGLRQGAHLVAWNGVPIQKALVAADTRWFKNAATKDDLALERLQALTRAPIGTHAVIEFFAATAEEQPNKEEALAKEPLGTLTATMTARSDNFADIALFDLAPIPTMEELRKNVEWRIMDGNIGYLRIYHVIHFDDYSQYPTEVTEIVAQALEAFNAAGVNSLILDLRGNRGGSDQAAADISGHFAKESSIYERTAWYNASSGRFDYAHSDLFGQTFELGDEPLWVEPRQPHFWGNIAVLVNPATISSGEGLAMAIGRQPNATVMGFYGTHGSFGLVFWPIAMPEGISFQFPIGRSLDAHGVIQIDSDASGMGGVQPEIRIPRTWQNIAAYASGKDV
ncbi:MAG: S41 family peptidase, partial [Rectinema sp.]